MIGVLLGGVLWILAGGEGSKSTITSQILCNVGDVHVYGNKPYFNAYCQHPTEYEGNNSVKMSLKQTVIPSTNPSTYEGIWSYTMADDKLVSSYKKEKRDKLDANIEKNKELNIELELMKKTLSEIQKIEKELSSLELDIQKKEKEIDNLHLGRQKEIQKIQINVNNLVGSLKGEVLPQKIKEKKLFLNLDHVIKDIETAEEIIEQQNNYYIDNKNIKNDLHSLGEEMKEQQELYGKRMQQIQQNLSDLDFKKQIMEKSNVEIKNNITNSIESIFEMGKKDKKELKELLLTYPIEPQEVNKTLEIIKQQEQGVTKNENQKIENDIQSFEDYFSRMDKYSFSYEDVGKILEKIAIRQGYNLGPSLKASLMYTKTGYFSPMEVMDIGKILEIMKGRVPSENKIWEIMNYKAINKSYIPTEAALNILDLLKDRVDTRSINNAIKDVKTVGDDHCLSWKFVEQYSPKFHHEWEQYLWKNKVESLKYFDNYCCLPFDNMIKDFEKWNSNLIEYSDHYISLEKVEEIIKDLLNDNSELALILRSEQEVLKVYMLDNKKKDILKN